MEKMPIIFKKDIAYICDLSHKFWNTTHNHQTRFQGAMNWTESFNTSICPYTIYKIIKESTTHALLQSCLQFQFPSISTNHLRKI